MKKDCKNFLKKRRIMLETLEDRRLLAVMGGALPMPQPTGAEIIVNSTTDPRTWSDTDTTVSLREAIETAQDGDVIKFDAKLNGKTITLSTSTLLVTKSVTIDASNLSNGVSVSGNGARGIFVLGDWGDGGESTGDITVQMNNLSLVKGNSRREQGGAIKSADNVTLTLNDCTIENCESLGDGGGIFSLGSHDE